MLDTDPNPKPERLPKGPRPRYNCNLSFTLSPDMAEALDDQCRKTGKGRSELLREILGQWLRGEGVHLLE